MTRKVATGNKLTIATLGSHCSLQVLRGAKDEGFRTLLLCEKRRLGLYSRFRFIDEIVEVDSFAEILDDIYRKRLKQAGSVLIPHGTLLSQMK
ncbi:MAG: DUF1246 domain-containing protein, partial [Thermoproteota archaeon]|nr:DUF1246 domain-containing protein [Thermoproteota archaeon]